MAALSVIGSTLNRQDLAPLSQRTGASSKSDPGAGSNAPINPALLQSPITTTDRAGAGILTVIMIVVVVGGAVWLIR